MAARWLIDGMNVIGSRPDGWWRDRPAAMRRLVEALEAFSQAAGEDVAVVFDGRAVEMPAAGSVAVQFAASADDAIVARVAADGDSPTLTVVTSDVELSRRVCAHGARVLGAGSFRRGLETPSSGADLS